MDGWVSFLSSFPLSSCWVLFFSLFLACPPFPLRCPSLPPLPPPGTALHLLSVAFGRVRSVSDCRAARTPSSEEASARRGREERGEGGGWASGGGCDRRGSSSSSRSSAGRSGRRRPPARARCQAAVSLATPPGDWGMQQGGGRHEWRGKKKEENENIYQEEVYHNYADCGGKRDASSTEGFPSWHMPCFC